LPFAFCISRPNISTALHLYGAISSRRPRSRNYAMIGAGVFAADRRSAPSFHFRPAQFLSIPWPPRKLPPVGPSTISASRQRAAIDERTRYSVVGSRNRPPPVQELLDQTHADEIIATGRLHHAARLHSFEIAAEQFRNLRP
jgi:hypothetical protein